MQHNTDIITITSHFPYLRFLFCLMSLEKVVHVKFNKPEFVMGKSEN